MSSEMIMLLDGLPLSRDDAEHPDFGGATRRLTSTWPMPRMEATDAHA